MNIEELRIYCLSKKGTSESLPFDNYTLVFKVMHKIFAITSLRDEKVRVNLKCAPHYSLELREKHLEIVPAYHMNKIHWNTVYFGGNLDLSFLEKLIDHSYELVVSKLPKKIRFELENIKDQHFLNL